MIIIDIGACVGTFIDSCLDKYGERVEAIYAFEPLRANYDFLIDKYRDDDRIGIINQAIGGFDGGAKFYKKNNKDGSDGDFVGNSGSSLKQSKTNVSDSYNKVSVTQLSTFLFNNPIDFIDIIKIDAEGAEYDILKDILVRKILMRVGLVYFEDHCRKVPASIAVQS